MQTTGLISTLAALFCAANISFAADSFDYARVCTLTNSACTVKIAPAVGRVIHFSLRGQKNILWLENPGNLPASAENWRNIGGDKVWPAQQVLWKFIYGHGDWPPRTELDSQPFRVIEAGRRRLVMESQPDSRLHVRLQRSFSLDAESARLTITNRLIQEAPTPWPVMIWSVTQCRPPRYTLLTIDPQAPDRKKRPYINLWDSPLIDPAIIDGRAMRFRLSPQMNIGKVGTIGRQVAAIYDDTLFVQTSDAPPDGCFPDGASIEVFSFDKYTELEVLSPARHLAPGQSITATTIWQLLPLAPNTPPKTILQKMEECTQ